MYNIVAVDFSDPQVDDDDDEMVEYMLQYMCGVTCEEDGSRYFHKAYCGPCTSFYVRDLHRDSTYTFRVCGRHDGRVKWSTWSVHHVAMTTIAHHSRHACTNVLLNNS